MDPLGKVKNLAKELEAEEPSMAAVLYAAAGVFTLGDPYFRKFVQMCVDTGDAIFKDFADEYGIEIQG